MNSSQLWKRKVLGTLIRLESEWGFDLMDDSSPAWQAKAAEKLYTASSVVSKIEKRSFDHFLDPRKLGGIVGVKKALSDAVVENVTRSRARVAKEGPSAWERILLSFFGVHESYYLPSLDWYLKKQRWTEEAAIRRCLSIASNQAGSELADFLGGLRDAVRTFVFDKCGASYGDTTATPIYRFLFMWGERCQECLHSLAELHELLRHILGSQVVGDQERVKKICARIGYTITSRGRPKGKRDISEILASLFRKED